jgi:Gpi18-like mannosyltransferase
MTIRLVLAPFVAHPFDVWRWYEYGQNVLDGATSIWTFLVPYSYSYFLFVFPASVVFHYLSAVVPTFTIPISSLDPRLNPGAPWNITVVPGLLFDFLVKLPLIASDTIVAILLYRIVLRFSSDERMAISASVAWFLNPLVIWVSSGWGMFDTLAVLFTVLSLYFVMENKFAYSGLALTAAVAMKYYPVVLMIPLFAIAWREGGRKGLVHLTLAIVGASVFLFLPLLAQSLQGFGSLIAGGPQLAMNYSGLSFWTAITLFQPVPYQAVISSALVATSLGGVYYLIAKSSSRNPHSYSAYFAFSIIPLLLFYRFVGENYFVWLIPFASILVLRSTRARILLWTLSVVALISSVTDSLLPYYLLPVAPWIGKYLIQMLSMVSSYRVANGGVVDHTISVGKIVLSALGIAAAVLLVLMALSLFSAISIVPNGTRSQRTEERKSQVLSYSGTSCFEASDQSCAWPWPRGFELCGGLCKLGNASDRY